MQPKDWDDLIESTDELRSIKYTQADIDAAVEAEREACATYVLQFGKIKDLKEVCDALADGIRMRSNAELTGVPPTDATKGE
jgi:hypothetical protein